MARDHARILTRIWRDPEWRKLPHTAQWLYLHIISRPDINAAGVVPVNVPRWARGSDDLTDDDVRTAFKALVQRRYIVVDEFEDEALVRSFMRNDGIVKQPKVMIGACRQAVQAESGPVRRALAAELERVRDEVSDMARREVDLALEELSGDEPEPPGNGREDEPAEGFNESYGNPIHGGAERVSARSNGGARKPNRLPSGVGEGAGKGVGSSPAPTHHSAPTELALVPSGEVEAAPAAPKTEFQRAHVLACAYYDREPMCKFIAVRGIVKTAIKQGRWSDEQIERALMDIADDGGTVSNNSLRIALDGAPRYRSRKPNTDSMVQDTARFLEPEPERGAS